MATKKKADTQDQTEPSRQQLLGKARNTAVNTLISENKERFDTLMQDAADDLKVEWKPRLTPQQRAKQQLEALIAEHPELVREFNVQPAEGQVEANQDDDSEHETV